MFFVIDIGTTLLKVALADDNGFVCSEIQTVRIQNNFLPQSWLSALEQAFSNFKSYQNKIEYIAITGNGPTIVPVSTNNSTQKVLLWKDRNKNNQIPGFMGLILQYKSAEPELFEKCRLFLGCPEYIAYMLTNCPCSAKPLQGFEHYYWNDELIKKNNIDKNQFPPFFESGTILGNTTGKHIFKKGIKVLVPYPDYIPSIIGSGAVHPGMLCLRTGTSDGINLCVSHKITDKTFMTSRHPNKTDWNLSYVIPNTGEQIIKKISELNLSTDNWDKTLQHPQIIPILNEICLLESKLISKLKKYGIKKIILAEGSMKSLFFRKIRENQFKIPVYESKCSETGLQGLAILAYSSINNSDIRTETDRIVQNSDFDKISENKN